MDANMCWCGCSDRNAASEPPIDGAGCVSRRTADRISFTATGVRNGHHSNCQRTATSIPVPSRGIADNCPPPPDRDATPSVSETGGKTPSEKNAPRIKRLLEDSQKLEKQLKVLFPESRLFLTPLKEQLVIKGQGESREEAAAILQIVKSAMSKYFADDLPCADPTAPAEQLENFIVNLIHVETVSVSLKVQAV